MKLIVLFLFCLSSSGVIIGGLSLTLVTFLYYNNMKLEASFKMGPLCESLRSAVHTLVQSPSTLGQSM